MQDIWREELRGKYPDNTLTVPPDSFLGFETFSVGTEQIGRYVRYERIGGQDFLADVVNDG